LKGYGVPERGGRETDEPVDGASWRGEGEECVEGVGEWRVGVDVVRRGVWLLLLDGRCIVVWKSNWCWDIVGMASVCWQCEETVVMGW
jgi:hypothetical protein